SSSTPARPPLARSLSMTPAGAVMPCPPGGSSAAAVRACSAVVSVTALSWASTAAAASAPGPSDSDTRGHSSTTQSEKDAESGSTVTIGEHTSELQSRFDLVCRLLLEKKKKILKV